MNVGEDASDGRLVEPGRLHTDVSCKAHVEGGQGYRDLLVVGRLDDEYCWCAGLQDAPELAQRAQRVVEVLRVAPKIVRV